MTVRRCRRSPGFCTCACAFSSPPLSDPVGCLAELNVLRCRSADFPAVGDLHHYVAGLTPNALAIHQGMMRTPALRPGMSPLFPLSPLFHAGVCAMEWGM